MVSSNNNINTKSLKKSIQNLIDIINDKIDCNDSIINELGLNEILKIIINLEKINTKSEQQSENSIQNNDLINAIFTNPKAMQKLNELIEIIDN